MVSATHNILGSKYVMKFFLIKDVISYLFAHKKRSFAPKTICDEYPNLCEADEREAHAETHESSNIGNKGFGGHLL